MWSCCRRADHEIEQEHGQRKRPRPVDGGAGVFARERSGTSSFPDAAACPPEAFRLMFTSNHDENSWAGTEFERMGDAAEAMAVLTFTLPNGQPLIYTGQEMGWNHRFEFFEKDPVPAWEENEYTDFYRKMISLRHRNPALAAGERGGKFEVVSASDSAFVFTRTLPENRVKVSVQLRSPWMWDISVETPESE